MTPEKLTEKLVELRTRYHFQKKDAEHVSATIKAKSEEIVTSAGRIANPNQLASLGLSSIGKLATDGLPELSQTVEQRFEHEAHLLVCEFLGVKPLR